ncbi:MAG: hypothetical protein LUG51_01225 [Tannerellaceae bacterium]|nr:hypothetical protein [Tannerellaceae bacterium]
MKQTISIQLFRVLQQGVVQLGGDALSQVKEYVISSQTPDGTFKGKNGQEDLYYSLFGWMLCYVLHVPVDTRKMEKYLHTIESEKLDLIHYAAWIRCRMLLTLFKKGKMALFLRLLYKTNVRTLDSFRMIPHDDPASPYTRFIYLSLLEDAGQRIEEKMEILQSLASYKVAGGGYANRKGSLTATVNATAAALSVKGQLEEYQQQEDIHYLRDIQDSTGGYKATHLTPVPDLLSTATALFTLHSYEVKPAVPPFDFIEAHWLDNGGFAATLLDETSDVEYTFYGLLALGSCR